jgi:iron uptake system component EfeO
MSALPVPQVSAPRRGVAAGGWLAAAALAAGLLAGCGAGSANANLISVSTGACGGRWSPAAAGWRTFQIQNASTEAAEVDLINPVNGAIYAEVAALGPNTTRPMPVDVGSGAYAFRCLLEDTDPITGPTVRIGGHAQGAAAVLPVTTDDLLEPASEYHAYVTAGLNVLLGQTAALAADVRAGHLAGARAAWLPAHLTYERLGAAYGTFGNFDTEIDGRPDGLVGGVSSRRFTGFYRVEYGLWHGQSGRELTGPADQLAGYARSLRAAFPAMEIDLLDIGLRTHEILENALEFQLTGHDDYGSGTTLATTAANITGTRELLQVLHPLLVVRYPGLPAVYTWLGRLQRLVDAQRRPDGRWTPVSQLAATSREMIDAAASQTLQELAPIAVITEPRRT